MPVGTDVRASRTIRMLGEEYFKDSIERGQQPRIMEGRKSRLNAHILPTIGDVPVTKWPSSTTEFVARAMFLETAILRI
jgi:hypothetical protein